MTLVHTQIDQSTFERIREHAIKAQIGGRSEVRIASERTSTLPEDQMVGQACEYTVHRYLGDPEGYFRRREQINQRPFEGDGGSDFRDLKLDVKGSLMRKSSNPRDYCLPVRPRERHAGWIYVAAFVDRIEEAPITCWLAGWIESERLPRWTEDSGPFQGAYTIKVPRLNPIKDLKNALNLPT